MVSAERREKISPLRNEENGLELELTLNREMFYGKVFLPVVGQALVEGAVLILGDVLWVPRPDWLSFVELLVLDSDFLDLLFLLRLVLVLIFDLLDLGLLFATLFGIFVFVSDLLQKSLDAPVVKYRTLSHLLDFLCDDQLNRIRDELGVLLYDVLNLFLFEIFKLILLQEESDLGTTTERGTFGVGGNREGTSSGRFPDVLFVVVVLRYDLDTLGNEVSGIKANTELADHGNIGTGTYSFHKPL